MTMVKIAKRTRRRGALDKCLTFARQRSARIAASPPLPSPFPPPRAQPPELSSLAVLAQALPWAEPSVPELPIPSRFSAVVVVCEGRFFEGDYELLERARRTQAADYWIASDVFVDTAQIVRARRAGADAISPLVRVLERTSLTLADLAGAARELGLDVVPQCASAEELEAALEIGCARALVSLRDAETLRPAIDEVAAMFETSRDIELVSIFADSLPEDLALRARSFDFSVRATHVTETQLQTPT